MKRNMRDFFCTNRMQCKILSTNNRFGNNLKTDTVPCEILLDGVTHPPEIYPLTRLTINIKLLFYLLKRTLSGRYTGTLIGKSQGNG